MHKLDKCESEIPEAFERGDLKSAGLPKAELEKYKAAAKATMTKDRRVSIRLSVPDLMVIRARAMEEGIPCQTFIGGPLQLRNRAPGGKAIRLV
jgi:predicted DNA binding CopG/RHH family protein